MVRFTFLFLLLVAQAVSAETSDAQFLAFLKNYCHDCHGGEKPKAELDLSIVTDLKLLHQDPKLWERVVKQVAEREMPPAKKPQPSEVEREQFTTFVTGIVHNPDPKLVRKDPGNKPLHRLSHFEYGNTIRDLFGVQIDAVKTFPSDGGGGGGFDNNASTLFVPPLLLENYLEAAESVLARVEKKNLYIVTPGMFVRERAAAEKIIQHFASRAFRHPVSEAEINRLMRIYDAAVSKGEVHEAAVKQVVKAILISPQFIFRVERDPIGAEPNRINDYELATRLSYFLWSSMPDEKLHRLARKEVLFEPEVLEEQLRRMLKDPKARAFSENFVSQWLHVRDLHTSAKPDPKRFPEYSGKWRDAIYREPIELFHYLLTEDGSLLDLLDADYTFLNETLAEVYQVQEVKGETFRRVTLDNPNRGGILTMPSVLTITSYAQRTSPVLRGKWILEEVLGTPPPPPPPLVASLSPDDSPKNGLTFRQRLEKHRQDPNCASCHQKMDPLGFALENFDPLGRWRDEIAGEPVDASGEMANGEKISNPAELKKALLGQKEQFLRNLTEKMLAYALGRGLEYYDMPTVKKITDAVVKDNYSSRTLLLEIVQSYPFQFRRGTEAELSSK